MFWKLCKFEFRSTCRSYFLLYTILFISAAIMSLGVRSRIDFGLLEMVFGIVSIVYVICMVISIILCIVNIVRNYNDTLFKRESYLTHTLPIPTWQIVLVKLLSAFFWIVLTGVITILSILLIGIGVGEVHIGQFVNINLSIGSAQLFDIFTVITMGVTEYLAGIMLIYFIITFTHTCYVQRARVLIGILLFLFCYFIGSFLYGEVLSHITLSMNVHAVLWLNCGVYFLVLVLLFLGTTYLLSHKLEVE